MLSRFFLSGRKEISNETSINVEKVSEWRLAIIFNHPLPETKHFHVPDLVIFIFLGPMLSWYPITSLTCWPDLSRRRYTHEHSRRLHWKCWVCCARTIRQLHSLPDHQLPSKRAAAVHKGGGCHGPLEGRAPGIIPRLDEFPWRSMRGLFAVCSASLNENIGWIYHTFRFFQRCFLFLLRDFFSEQYSKILCICPGFLDA